jgi:hypothetical protein
MVGTRLKPFVAYKNKALIKRWHYGTLQRSTADIGLRVRAFNDVSAHPLPSTVHISQVYSTLKPSDARRMFHSFMSTMEL